MDGALRSAQIDESEADMLDQEDPRREEILASARRWREQASLLATREEQPGGNGGSQDDIMIAASLYDSDTAAQGLQVQGSTLSVDDLTEEDWEAIARLPNPLLTNPEEDTSSP